MNKTCYNMEQLLAEKQRILQLSKAHEETLNQKVNYLQDNLLGILWQSVSKRTDGKNSFTELLNSFAGINNETGKGSILRNTLGAILPTLIIAALKNFVFNKIKK